MNRNSGVSKPFFVTFKKNSQTEEKGKKVLPQSEILVLNRYAPFVRQHDEDYKYIIEKFW